MHIALIVLSPLVFVALGACDGHDDDSTTTGAESGSTSDGQSGSTSDGQSGSECQRSEDCPGYDPESTCEAIFCHEGWCLQEHDGYPPGGNDCFSDADCDDQDPCTTDRCMGVAYDCSQGTSCTHARSTEPACGG